MRRLMALVTGLVLVSSLSVATAGAASEEMGKGRWIRNATTNHYYTLVYDVVWPDAEARAEEVGGHLVTINDAAEDAWLEATFPMPDLWIGLNDVVEEGTFVWASGEPVTYTNWCPGQPDDWQGVGGEDYGFMNSAYCGGTGWDDADGGPFDGIIEVDQRPTVPAPAAAQPMNHFTGSFDMVSGDDVVAQVVADFREPTAGGTVAGSVTIRWTSGDIRQSRAHLSNAFFNAWDPPNDDPDEGFEHNAFVQGTLCEANGADTSSCQPFAMVFVQTLDPTYPNHVGFSVPGSDVCCDGAWYEVGSGVFRLNYVRETP